MVFGKPKKVGMKPAKKVKVPKAETAAGEVNTIEEVASVEQQPPKRKSAKLETPPQSPRKATVPPSPGKQKINLLASELRFMNKLTGWYVKAVGDGENTFHMAKKVFHAKLNVIEKAARRKVKPITPRQELNRLWNAESTLHKAHVCFVLVREQAALECVKQRDCHLVLLEAKLRRMSSRLKKQSPKQKGVMGSPIARFKCMHRK